MIHLKISYSNILIIEKILEIFRKNTMEIFGNFPEKYEIFRTIFPPHITTRAPQISDSGGRRHNRIYGVPGKK